MNTQARRWFFIALLALAMVGVGLGLYAMRTGPAIRGDSVRYVMGARNLLAGNGFSRLSGGGEIYPETGFAPFLSFVLAGFGLVGIDMFAGIRLLNAVLLGSSIFLTGFLVADAVESPWVGLLGATLTLTAANVFGWHTWLMSEPLFIFLVLFSLAALIRHLRSDAWGWLVVGAVAGGAAALARYVGVSLVPVGVIGILLWGKGSRDERIRRAATFGLLAGLPFVLWMFRNSVVGGEGFANRQIRFHPFRPDALKVFLFQPTTWVLPSSIVLPRTVRGAIALLALVGGPVLFLRQAVRRRSFGTNPGDPVLPWLLLLLVPCYVGILMFNWLFLDAGTTYDGILRYLTPLFVLLVILDLTTYALAFPEGRARRVLGVVVGVWLAVFIATNASLTIQTARDSTRDVGFTMLRTDRRDLANALMDAPTIISNNPEMVYFLTDRPAYMIPIKFDRYQQTFREDFQDQMDLAWSRLRAGSVLAIFGDPSAEQAEVIDLLHVVPLRVFGDTAVYGYRP